MGTLTTVAIIQARMGSTRLPGKVLMDLGGKTVLARVVRRLRRAKLVDQVVVATSTARPDNLIIGECERLRVPCLRGSETDVLDRYYCAAQALKAEVIVRITSDCPLIDPDLVDETIAFFYRHSADYASNAVQRSYPRGLDTEVFICSALDRAWREASLPHEREHVTPYFYEHPELFRIASMLSSSDHSDHRWTLDTAEDLELVSAIYSRFDNQDEFSWHDVLDLMEREPQLARINSHIRQKAVHAV